MLVVPPQQSFSYLLLTRTPSPLSSTPSSHGPTLYTRWKSHNNNTIYAISLSPLPFFPTSQTSHTAHTVPLYLDWYLLPSKAQVSKELPL